MKHGLMNKLIAHRGGKYIGLENTKEAFQGAINLGYYGIELDIQPTKDGRLVVFHDLNLKRLANVDMNIIDCEWDYLKTVLLTKVEVDQQTYHGHIMLFEDFLTLINNTQCRAFIEMKETFSTFYVHQMFEIIESSGIDKNQIIIIANLASISILIEIRKINQDIKLQFVAKTDYKNYLDDCIKYQIDLDISKRIYLENKEEFIDNIKRFHENGLEVNCWVVDDIALLKELEEIGVDYITTDSLKFHK